MKRSQVFLLFFLIATLFLSSCTLNREVPETQDTPTPGAIQVPETPTPEPEIVDSQRVVVGASTAAVIPGEVIIKFVPETAAQLPNERNAIQGLSLGSESLQNTFTDLGITEIEPLLGQTANALGVTVQSLRDSDQAGDAEQIYVARFDPNQPVETVAATLTNEENVEYAEPNFVAFATGGPSFAPAALTPNDRFFNLQWNMQAIQMPQAWDISTGSNVVVAILDTGVAYETRDQFIQAPDLANTQFVQGYDFVNSDFNPNDDQGHGTHVAGTIAQSTNNGEGVAGVAFNAAIMPVKVLDSQGQGGYAAIIQGIDFAVNNGAKVINLSLAGASSAQSLQSAVDRARARGVLVVVSSGNRGGSVEFPAFYPSTLAVGAVRFDRTRASYSNFGPSLDLVAPGGDNGQDQNGDGYADGILQQTFIGGDIRRFNYQFWEGTSMAAPHVSGVAALLFSRNPNLNANQVEDILTRTAQDLGQGGRDDQYGFGLVQAANALNFQPGPPTPTPTPPPTGPTPTPGPIPPDQQGNILKNSNFEGTDGWSFKPTVRTGNYTNQIRHSGEQAAVVGITDSNNDAYSFSSVSQQVTIPANANKVTLRAWVYPVTQNPNSTDKQIISILNSHFREIQRLRTIEPTPSNAQTWQEYEFDVTHYKGQTIYVYFGAVNRTNDGRTTALYVDDVTLIVE